MQDFRVQKKKRRYRRHDIKRCSGEVCRHGLEGISKCADAGKHLTVVVLVTKHLESLFPNAANQEEVKIRVVNKGARKKRCADSVPM